MENLEIKFREKIVGVCQHNNSLRRKLQQFLKKKQVWSSKDHADILTILSPSILSSSQSSTIMMAQIMGPFTVDLLQRSIYNCKSDKTTEWENISEHENICIVLGYLTCVSIPCLTEFVLSYFEKNGPPFQRLLIANKREKNDSKKRKKMIPDGYGEIFKATYLLLSEYPSILKRNWRWSDLLSCMDTKDAWLTSEAKWFLEKCIALVCGLRSVGKCTATNIEERLLLNAGLKVSKSTTGKYAEKQKAPSTSAFSSLPLSSGFTSVAGVLLHKEQKSDASEKVLGRRFVVTETLRFHLQELALAVSEGKAVVLEGPVGCGKTALVEYLAQVTGHASPPSLTKVQLSDDTDSKTLTGTYVCSNIPGQFYWQPGLLVQACKEGYWVLLEDIDMAPMDVISLLLPIVESGQFSVPGHYNKNIEVSSKFRLFMTRRSSSSTTLAASVGVNMILKHAKSIKLHLIPEEDLRKVITTKFPNLATVVDKLLIIYHNLKESKAVLQSSFTLRKPSTRDLLKWCNRISRRISKYGSEDISVPVALSAMDCFVASCPRPDTRLLMTQTITIELNISTDKAEYYCQSYKPAIEIDTKDFRVGNTSLSKIKSDRLSSSPKSNQPFAFTRHSSVLLERIASCVRAREPVLLVGETGVGKTSALQYLAEETGRQLHVINMSQQSSSSDLLGGYKPAQLCHLIAPVREEFERLFSKTFSMQQNMKFLTHIQTCFVGRRYNDLWQLMMHSCSAAIKMLKKDKKNRNRANKALQSRWEKLVVELNELQLKLKSDSPIAFNFIEGKLSQCIERGDWLLLDEINLASTDTLECLSCVLESESGSLVLMERGDAKPLSRHNEFRLFAAMNPATDVGKRSLPEGVQNRFTEIFVDEPTECADIATIVAYYLNKRTVGGLSSVDGIVQFYLAVRKLAAEKLVDGAGRKPHYSLRTLCRALRYVVDNSHITLTKALYEGFCLSFLTALDRSSHPQVVSLIAKHVIGKKSLKPVVTQPIPKPDHKSIEIQGHHIRSGDLTPFRMPHYILTSSVNKNLKDLARPVSYGKYPILIQGETSTGKTSLIKYLAAATGNKVIRINNHEHTDLQEYVGYYASDKQGKLVFQDGPLVTAMREGQWVILDELNLAPTDILEALNRVLDDNRELFITETQEVVRAHPRFTLFATQNPPGLYGGRKVLSRAFRNRFVELHFDEIPTEELQIILNKRCNLSPGHSKKLIKVMLDLQARRKGSGLFSGKHGFMTLRDLFRWAERHRRFQKADNELYDWEQHLVDDGFLLLASKVRKAEEEKVIEEVLLKHFNRAVDHERLFGNDAVYSLVKELPRDFDHVVWTKPMRRLYVTLERAMRFDEPVLLVGETGGGKTTACQLISMVLNKKLSIINCHASTEAADFIGGLRPTRHRDQSQIESKDDNSKSMRLFEWIDGPLVQTMLSGNHILIDEISLADDSVLERLNSVLEPERTLVIPDKASMTDDDQSDTGSFISARDGFQFLATMNPGGDYGKKELSPALRNRMTEIWCDVVHEDEDLTAILQHNLQLTLPVSSTEADTNYAELYAKLIVEFVSWFKLTLFGKRFVISVRDLITWSNFMRVASGELDLPSAYVHAACLVYIDGLGSGLSGAFAAQSAEAHGECLKFVVNQLKKSSQFTLMAEHTRQWLESEINGKSSTEEQIIRNDREFGIKPFSIKLGPETSLDVGQFSFGAHTTSINALRVVRALQLSRPVLLEGSPGGGKTSLVAAIARAAGFKLVRINLSEQTDASDLFGADLPLENGKGGEFSWRDGPLLAAMKAGHWVVLDELNLASQSVLESLNSVFDHRGELYIPELDRKFQVDRDQTKIFACQNPLQEGGGRKGLPKSFLNRFTQVHVDNLSQFDLFFILSSSFPLLPQQVLNKMVALNQKVYEQVVCKKLWAHKGAPWEFNLRDLTRWCTLVNDDETTDALQAACKHVYLIYSERMRSASDRNKFSELFAEVFGKDPYNPSRFFHVTEETVQVGNTLMQRKNNIYFTCALKALILPSLLHPTESLMTALNKNWPCIITGSPGAGKTLLVNVLAGLAGRKLRTLSMNSAMDAMELLGGYEQSDTVSTVLDLLDSAQRSLVQACQDRLRSVKFESNLSLIQKLMLIIEKLRSLSDHVEMKQCEKNSSDFLPDIEAEITSTFESCLRLLQESPVGQHMKDTLARLTEVFLERDTKGSYKWSDSVLVKALRDGDWLLIDGANFCSASVLDRLNALLEPNGILTITERGVLDGSIPEVCPHKDFRLIFAMDPFHGELSRAMRNRCIEIHLPSDNFYDFLAVAENAEKPELEGLTWEEVHLINKSKCSNAEELLFCESAVELSESKPLSRREYLSLFDEMLARSRCDLEESHNPENSNVTQLEKKGMLSVYSPSLADFINCPGLSTALRQFQVFEKLSKLQEVHDYDRNTIATAFSRVFIELATSQDHSFRKLLLGKFFFSKNYCDNPIEFKTMLTGLLDFVFSSQLLTKESTSSSLPWDPRWALQAVRQQELDSNSISNFSKLQLHIIFLQSKYEEDLLCPAMSLKSNKSLLKLTPVYHLAMGFSTKQLLITDLPDSSLVFLVPLRQAWNEFVLNALTSRNSLLAGEEDFVRCEGCLRRASFIWKKLMSSKFAISSFTTFYLRLKKEMLTFTKILGATTSDHYSKLITTLENLDKVLKVDINFEKEHKFQNKVRTCITDGVVRLYSDKEQCFFNSCLLSLIKDFSNHVLIKVKKQVKTKLEWPEMSSLLDRFVQAFSSPKTSVPCGDLIDVDETKQDDQDLVVGLATALKQGGIKLSAATYELLNSANVDVEMAKDANVKKTLSNTFALSKQCLSLYSLKNFCLVLSQLALFSSEPIATEKVNFVKLFQSIPALDVMNFFKMVMLFKGNWNVFAVREYLTSKMLAWPQPIPYKKQQKTDIFEGISTDGKDGVASLLTPHVCRNAVRVLYEGASRKMHVNVASVDLMQRTLWSNIKVPLGEVADKLSQLEAFSNVLWTNASILSQVLCPGTTLTLPSPLMHWVVGFLRTFDTLLNLCHRNDEKRILAVNDQLISACCQFCEFLKLYTNDFGNRSAYTVALLKLQSTLTALTGISSSNCGSDWTQLVLKLVLNCIAALKRTLESIKISDVSKCERKEKILSCWKSCGEGWIWCGYLQMLLTAPRCSVDPIDQFKSKVECFSFELTLLRCDMDVHNLSHQNLTGRNLVENNQVVGSNVHPRINASLHHLNNTRGKIERNSLKTAYRPDNNQFLQLSKDCTGFITTAGNLTLVEDVIRKISSVAKKQIEMALKTEEKMQNSYDSFSRSLEEKYPAYPDFIKPVQDAIAQIRFGLKLMRESSSLLLRHKDQQQNLMQLTSSSMTPEQFLVKFIDGRYSVHEIDSFVTLLKSMHFPGSSDKYATDKIIDNVLVASLLRCRNTAIRSCNSDAVFNDVIQLLEIVIVLWNKREQLRIEREAEEASLYKYKEKTHMAETEEQEEEKHFNFLFPTYDEDVKDLADADDQIPMQTEEPPQEEQDSEETLDVQETDDDLALSKEAFDLAAVIHAEVLTGLLVEESLEFPSPVLQAKTTGKKKKKVKKKKQNAVSQEDNSSEMIFPMLFSHTVLCTPVRNSLDDFYGGEVDHCLLASHLITCSKLKEVLSSERYADIKKETVNVYKEPLPSEASRCLEILREMRNTLVTYLQEWPDHPVITILVRIINRILSFSITSPLMKFITGLELLLSKAQDWECNASSKVSLSNHLQAVTSLVIDWRRLELKSWNRLLDDTRARAGSNPAKWWFYIYQLVEDCIEKTKNEPNSSHVVDVVTSLQKFVESSTIGQFKKRVALLAVFYRHLVMRNRVKDPLTFALYNMHCYYGHYVPTNESRIETLRNPIEKELKEFVKIAKWNDLNFYAVKESVKKTHHTLFKFMEKFSKALAEPVGTSVLNVAALGFSTFPENSQSVGMSIALKWKDVVEKGNGTAHHKQNHFSLVKFLKEYFVAEPQEDSTLKEVKRLPSILTKLSKHTFAWLKDISAFLPDLLINFEAMIADVIEGFVELRKLEPKTPLSKDEEQKNKRLAEAKHINARKRKALADLFKLLRVIGLSYRKGIVWEKKFDHKEIMLTPSPCKIPSPPNHSEPLDHVERDATSGSHNYFYKMISRWSALLAASLNPNKVVIGPILDRCRGFVGHLVSLSLGQRRNFTQLQNAMEEIAELEVNLRQLAESEQVCSLPFHQDTINRLLTCSKATETWLDCLWRFKELLKACRKMSEHNECDALISVNVSLPRAARFHGDDLWLEVMDRVKKEIANTEAMATSVSDEIQHYCHKSGKPKFGVLIKPSTVELVRQCGANLKKSSTCFCDELIVIFDSQDVASSSSENHLIHSPLLNNIIEGKKIAASLIDDVQSSEDSSSDVSHEEILESLNQVLSQIMFAVQELVKNNVGVEGLNPVDGDLFEHHFFHHLHERSIDYFKHLNVDNIHSNLFKLMENIRKLNGKIGNKLILSLLFHSLVPLLGKYTSLLRHVSMVMALVNRTTCKFAFILASISAEVVSKGFCPLAEFQEEIEGEEGEFKEVDDAGIGEGEGSKDVSDQIEEESQVEDRPDEDKEDQKDDIPGEDNAIEMSNDFEGQFQDDAPMDEKEEKEDEDEDEEEEFDKQMGDLGDEEKTEKLDERMWGSDDEDEDEQDDKSDEKKEEKGKGMDAEESELLAKDDQLDDGKDEEEQGDQSEFNPNERDDDHDKDPPPSPEPLDLPDEMNVADLGAEEDQQEEETEELNKNEETSKELDDKDLPPETEDDEKAENEDVDQNEDQQTEEDGEKSGNEEEEADAEVPPDLEEESDGEGEEKPAEEQQLQENKKDEEKEENEKEEEDQDESGGQGTQLPNEEDIEQEDKTREDTDRNDRVETEDNIEQCETANEDVMKQANEEGKKEETTGMAPSADQHGEESTVAAPQTVQNTREETEKPKENERKVGESDSKRSLGEAEDILPKKLKLMDEIKEQEDGETDEKERNESADMYQHITEDVKEYDKQTRDAATEEQMKKQPVEMEDEKDNDANLSDDNDENTDEATVTYTEMDDVDEKSQLESKSVPIVDEDMIVDANEPEETKEEKPYRVVNEEGEMRDLPTSSIHTNMSDWEPSSSYMSLTPEEVGDTRRTMEEHLRSISSLESSVEFAEAEQMWHQYQSLTQPLSQQLSEQLRLILEPTRAAKLKGDYRTGKRLNMRKVIPYIASGFRKDKIWLRRSKPSKREYQIMVAMDDSSSMADNHTKQLAFEALAVISTALTTIESGQLSVCNFGEETKLLHDFNQPFTDKSGASILQRCSFKQEQTKVAHLLDNCVKFLKTAQTNYTSSADPRLSQLLVIVSDGRGLYIEGKEKVEAAVRAAKDARVFLAFVILDNPAMKDSILDIKVPVFKHGGKVEFEQKGIDHFRSTLVTDSSRKAIDIRSYMADFPFPFYVIIRNINSLPETLSEALRQWFEIVASGD